MALFGFIPDFIEMMNMVSGGHPVRHGFEPTLRAANGTAQALQQLAAGQAVHPRCGDRHDPRGFRGGRPFHGGGHQPPGIDLPHDQPAGTADRTGRYLRGKTVGLVSVGGITDTFLDLILRRVNIPRSEMRTETTGNSPAAIQFIRQGRVDCFMASIIVPVVLRQQNKPIGGLQHRPLRPNAEPVLHHHARDIGATA